MQLEFYKRAPDFQLRWDLTEEGISLLTGAKSILFDETTLKVISFFVDPEIAIQHAHEFPDTRTRPTILNWMIKSGLFSHWQAFVLRLFPNPKTIKEFALRRKSYFPLGITHYTKKYKHSIREYLEGFQDTDTSALVGDFDTNNYNKWAEELKKEAKLPLRPADE